eukprot:31028_1
MNESNNADPESEYYSFGTQYKYTKNLSAHPLFVKPKFKDLKQELMMNFAKINRKGEPANLLNSQLDKIEKLDAPLRPILRDIVLCTNKSDEVCNLWTQQKDDDIIQALVNSCKQLMMIIKSLCCYLGDNEINNILLDQMYSLVQLQFSLSKYLSTLSKDERLYMAQIIHKYNNEQTEQNVQLLSYSILKVYSDIFPPDKNETLSTQILTMLIDAKHKSDQMTNILQLLDVNIIHHTIIKNKTWIKETCEEKDGFTLVNLVYDHIMRRSIKQYCLNETNLSRFFTDNSADEMGNILMKFFTGEYGESEIKNRFVKCAKITIQQKLQLNKARYRIYEQQKLLAVFIEKCKLKMNMKSVKQLKASYYQGINKEHQIHPGQPIQDAHVLSLIIYTQCTLLCTTFRETYRPIKDEGLVKQKARHSVFGHLGKHLYESFAFYASFDGKIEILYHGMGQLLLFKTLYCTFSAPTSTTTASSIA